ncbi:MAG: pyridoxal phosphate-dependent aminotransferase [Planctomycetes bacterium]|nr:pyridoxal phosphate-dependent aminotransferase [Planctomycetota bacterium]
MSSGATLPDATLGAFRPIPYMGVIYVVAEAMKLGFQNGHPDWCNLGQGQPEVGAMEGAPPRFTDFRVEPRDHAYGPVNGTPELREAIARHYNRLYRVGKRSQYSAENVTVAAGGRLVLTRLFTALGSIRLGYQVPDYTAYEDMLATHLDRLSARALVTDESEGFLVSPLRLAREAEHHDLGAFLLSNPCNPTGRVLRGSALAAYVELARTRGMTLLLDEFYSHFIYEGERPAAGPVSAAAFVEDVERDPVVLVDGLTKNFRYPGWRVGWALGPRAMVDALTRAASAIDGGPSMPVQRAAVEVLAPARADQETSALRRVFARKRNLMIARLEQMGIRCPFPSEGTFYVWASLAALKPPLNEAEVFFRRALEQKVLTVPGKFFDVNPRKQRPGESPYGSWARFSFGPPEANVALGLERLEAMLSA